MARGKTTAAKRTKHNDVALTKKVVAGRKKGAKWGELAEELGITPGKAQFLYMVANVADEDKITGRTDKELAKKIVKARDKDLLSWGAIAARAGIPEGKVKKLYAEAGGGGVIKNVASARKPKDKPATKRTSSAKRSTAKAATSEKASTGTAKRTGKRGKRGRGARRPSSDS